MRGVVELRKAIGERGREAFPFRIQTGMHVSEGEDEGGSGVLASR